MKHPVVLAGLASALFPQLSAASDLTFGSGIGVTSNYVSDGLSETANRPAIQPYFEIGKNGFYAGVWASNVRDTRGNRAALDLYGGYRNEVASGVIYDLGVTQHYRNKSGKNSAEISAVLGFALSDRLTVIGEASYDLSEKGLGASLTADYAVSKVWGVSAFVGRADPASDPNWGAAASYRFNDRTSIDLEYQDTSSTKGLMALTLNYKFGTARE
jgi:uncharacterized protein (TIGR02001 family)